MKNYVTVLLCGLMLLLGGCASVPMASVAEDAKAKEFAKADGKSRIYVYRNENFGAAIKMPVLLNNVAIGDTAAKTFLLEEVKPGTYTIVSKTENDASLQINTEAGKNYYVWQEVKLGAFSARSKLHLMSEEEGQKGVLQCKLVK